MLKKRNAQGLSINVIILAVIGLIILVVVIMIFTKESERSVGTLERCESRGGNCIGTGDSCSGRIMPNVECGSGEKCCVTI